MYAKWEDAPEWANWHAVDKDGVGNWYALKPLPFESEEQFKTPGKYEYSDYVGIPILHWESTLEQRPNKEVE